jgi:hypothetical protein
LLGFPGTFRLNATVPQSGCSSLPTADATAPLDFLGLSRSAAEHDQLKDAAQRQGEERPDHRHLAEEGEQATAHRKPYPRPARPAGHQHNRLLAPTRLLAGSVRPAPCSWEGRVELHRLTLPVVDPSRGSRGRPLPWDGGGKRLTEEVVELHPARNLRVMKLRRVVHPSIVVIHSVWRSTPP